MSILSHQQKQALNSRIRDIEAQASAELVTIICKKSDDYFYIPLLFAALSALALPLLIGFLPDSVWQQIVTNFNAWNDGVLNHGVPYSFFILQIILFVLVAVLVQVPRIKMALVPESVRHQRARRHGHELFFIEGLHLTKDRTGVLFFVSEAERYVEIMTDQAIGEGIAGPNDEQWQQIVANFVARVKDDQIFLGYDEAIEACGELLIAHFPATSQNDNELPDHLIEL
jgi:putative membrane protein